MHEIKLIVDENISWRLKKHLKDWQILPVVQILTNQRINDHAIWKFAKANNYHILTFDEDFTDIQNLQGYPPKIIWLRFGNSSTAEIALRLTDLKIEITDFCLTKN
ncbi:MAG: hypothetical protein EOP42_08850 [Sphingobacteriaceae bacterium]|nr:MAG: hypothetical protein EOP42_08850 [Sphingobacteriaceae bacterium]